MKFTDESTKYALKLKKGWENTANQKVRVRAKNGNYYYKRRMSKGQQKALKKLIKDCVFLGEGADGYLYYRKKEDVVHDLKA